MTDIQEYLTKTKSAVEKYFEGWYEYSSILYEVKKPHFSNWGEYTEEVHKKYKKWQIENEEALNKALKNEERYVDELFAQSTFAGAILELAHAGLKRYSTNQKSHPLVSHVIKTNSKLSQFCVGRIENRLPIGLIVLGGRNLHNHIDEDKLREPNLTIFNVLSGKSFSKYTNSYYDIDAGQRYNVLSNLIHLLKWNSYKDFEKDLLDMCK